MFIFLLKITTASAYCQVCPSHIGHNRFGLIVFSLQPLSLTTIWALVLLQPLPIANVIVLVEMCFSSWFDVLIRELLNKINDLSVIPCMC